MSARRRARLVRALAVEITILAAIILPVVVLFAAPDNPTGLRLVLVGGPSMQPLLGTRANVLLMRRADTFQRFDVARLTRGSVHRVLALPGETFWIRQGHVCVSAPGEAAHCLHEPFVAIENSNWNRPPRHLGPDEYAWGADNRQLKYVVVLRRQELDAVLVRVLFAAGGRFH
jgi:hypothetical protein